MTPIDYSRFRVSLRRLAEQLDNHRTPPPGRTRLDAEGVAESVIRRFATCYDCLWNVLKRYLIQVLGRADAPTSPTALFRTAGEHDLLAAPVEQWMRYVTARVDTTPDYDGEKAERCLEIVPDFLQDAILLYQTMKGEPWD